MILSLSISVLSVRAKCGLTSDEFDGELSSLILEQQPALEEAIRPECFSMGAGVAAVMNLAAVEIVAGEFCAQLARRPGWADQVVVQGLAIQPYIGRDPADPSGLKSQGWNRVRPYLKVDPIFGVVAPVLRGGDKHAEVDK